jgi:hypothetical protein
MKTVLIMRYDEKGKIHEVEEELGEKSKVIQINKKRKVLA